MVTCLLLCTAKSMILEFLPSICSLKNDYHFTVNIMIYSVESLIFGNTCSMSIVNTIVVVEQSCWNINLKQHLSQGTSKIWKTKFPVFSLLKFIFPCTVTGSFFVSFGRTWESLGLGALGGSGGIPP